MSDFEVFWIIEVLDYTVVLQISIKVRVSYSDFKVLKKKNTKKIRRTLKVHISGTAWCV